MEIAFTCFNCGVAIEAESELCGDQLGCPNCDTVLLVPAAGIWPGSRLGGFEVLRRVGVGGMGEVFLAKQVALDRDVALKVLPPAMTRSPELLTRFLHEIQMAGKLDHPNIVSAFDAGEDDGFYFLAMSFVEGEDLADRLEREKQFSEREGLEICAKMADALGYAWNKYGLLHRDIKPANIMVDSDGTVKLMDMGIAKTMTEDSKLTMVGLFVGTPYYMSPEQAQSLPTMDFRSDIYALGATLYHLITGTRPFDAQSAVAVLTKHVTAPLPDPRTRRADVSASTATLLHKMMAKDPNDRHASWEALGQEVRTLLSSQTLMSTRASAARGHAPPTVLGTSAYPEDAETLVQGAPTMVHDFLADADIPLLKPTQANRTVALAPEDDGEGEVPAGSTIVAAPAIVPAQPIPKPKESAWKPPTKASNGLVYSVVALIALTVIAVILVIVNQTRQSIEDKRAEAKEKKHANEMKERVEVGDIDAHIGAKITEAEVKQLARERMKRLDEMVVFARNFARQNRYSIKQAIAHFQKVKDHGKGTKFELVADDEIRKLKERLALAPNEIYAGVRAEAQPYAVRGQLSAAARVYERYRGPFAEETKKPRLAQADLLQAEAKRKELVTRWVCEAWGQIRVNNHAEFTRIVEIGQRSRKYADVRQAIIQEIAHLETLRNWPQRIMGTYEVDRGQTITVRTIRGAREVKIVRRVGSVVYASAKGRELRLTANDLAYAELTARTEMLPDDVSRAHLRAALALRSNMPGEARAVVNGRPGVLAGILAGDALASQLRGSWNATKFGGPAYANKPSKFKMMMTGTRAFELTFDGKGANVAFYTHGSIMYVSIGNDVQELYVEYHGGHSMHLEPRPGIELTLTRR